MPAAIVPLLAKPGRWAQISNAPIIVEPNGSAFLAQPPKSAPFFEGIKDHSAEFGWMRQLPTAQGS